MKGFWLGVYLLWATLQRCSMQIASPATVSNCCEGDILLLLDSSGSVANYEFSRLLLFATELLRPFSLGRGHVRVGLLQVGTNPQLEFGLDAHVHQEGLRKALQSVSQLQGDTNTEAALGVAQRVLTGTGENVPKILLWLTDGVQPGGVDGPMSGMKARGVSVLAVSTVHGNHRVLQRAVTPPPRSHLYSVDIDSIDIITEELRDAIIQIIGAERLRVVHLTPHSAVLQWRPVLSTDSGFYELRYNSAWTTDNGIGRILPGDSASVQLTDLQPDTAYTAALRPVSNHREFNTLSVNFTTLPDTLSPAVVLVSDSGPRQIRVSWGPLQAARVQRYTLEYGAIPSGDVRTLTFPGQQNSTVLTGLQPDTQYLVTVSALHADGEERAMTVRACTQEASLPALADLRVTQTERQETEVAWQASRDGLEGYWLSWEAGSSYGLKPSTSSVYLPPTSGWTRLARLAPRARVCVSPVYSSGRGDGLCCTAGEPHPDRLS